MNMMGHTALVVQLRVAQFLHLPFMARRSLFSFPGSAPPNNRVNSESVIDGKPADSGVMIGYQVDELLEPG